jgi:hypothetical protein
MNTQSLLRLTPAQQKSLKKEEGFFPIEQAIIVPSTKGVNRPVSKPEFKSRIKEVRNFLTGKFGGYTSVAGTGGFYSDDLKRNVKEKVVIVTSFARKKDYKKHGKEVFPQLKKWDKAWGQYAMGYEFGGELMYISKNFPLSRKQKLKDRMQRKMK